MAKGLLISFAGFPVSISSLFPDNGLASLAGTLIANGHEVKVLDYNTVSTIYRLVPREISVKLSNIFHQIFNRSDPEILKELFGINKLLENNLIKASYQFADEINTEIAKQQSDFVGFKLWSGDGFQCSVLIAEQIKKAYPNIKIFAGGPAVLYSEETVFKYTKAFDALVDGEGELAIVGLAKFSEGKNLLQDIPNLIIKDGPFIKKTKRSLIQDMNKLAPPVYNSDIYPSMLGNDHLFVFVLDESRGCPMKCTFCIHKNASGKKWRVKNPLKIIEEIKFLNQQYGIHSFRFSGSNTPAKFYNGLADALESLKLKIKFSGFAYPQGIRESHLEKIANSGCVSLFLGVESFSAQDQLTLGKNFDIDQTCYIIKSCLNFGIIPVISIIYPLPGQSHDSMRENYTKLTNLCSNTNSVVVTQIPCLLPRTAWWKNRDRYRIYLSTSEDEYRKLLLTYKVRFIIPPSYWEPAPYNLDGLNFDEYSQLNAKFQRELADAGITLSIPDETILLYNSRYGSLNNFRSTIQKLLFTLDSEQIKQFVINANHSLRAI